MNLTGRRDITLESALHAVGRRNVYRIAGLERRLYFSLQSPSCALVGSSCGTFGALAGGGTCCTDPIIGDQAGSQCPPIRCESGTGHAGPHLEYRPIYATADLIWDYCFHRTLFARSVAQYSSGK